MANGTKTIKVAREKIRSILRQYRLTWRDIAPDLDQEIWNEIRPAAKQARKELFKKSYPTLYAKISKAKG